MKIKIPLRLIEVEDGNYHLIFPCRFNDGFEGNWVIDTGASKTVFDRNLEKYFIVLEETGEDIFSAGIGENSLETVSGMLKPFSIGKMEIKNLKVALINLSNINNLYKKVTELEICGLIGGDFLMKYEAEISYKKQILVIKI